MTDITGFSTTNKNKIPYANISSIVKPEKIVVVEETVTSEQIDVEEEVMQVDEVLEEDSSEDKEYLPEI